MRFCAAFLIILFTLAGPRPAFGQSSAVPHSKAEGAWRIALLGCHRQFEPAPALAKYLELDPDLCLWVGDNIYGDTRDNPRFLDSCYAALAAKPAFRMIKARYPYMATWDDHDFGLNNAGKEYALKAYSKEKFRRFWDLEAEIPEDRDGIYYARRFEVSGKQVQIILLDVRYNRDQPGESGDVLGEAQWSWLADQLRQPADLRLLVSGFQLLLDRESSSETWAKFPESRQRLFELIRASQAEGVVFITGDQHYGEVCRMPRILDYDAIELQFAGINQIEDPEFNSYRVSTVCASLHSYAYIDLQLEPSGTDLPHLTFKVCDAVNDQVEVVYRVNLSEVGFQVGATAERTFVGEHSVSLTHSYPGMHLRYTLDGSSPDEASPRYERAISIDRSTTVTTGLFTDTGMARSAWKRFYFEKVEPLPGVRVKGRQGGLAYRYYEGAFSHLPDTDTLEVLRQGVARNWELKSLAGREDQYALVFEGFITVPRTGMYTFYSRSDDGSKVYLHDRLVVDNDGSHSARTRSGQIALEEGKHPFRVAYFEDIMGESLQLRYEGPGLPLQEIPFSAFSYTQP